MSDDAVFEQMVEALEETYINTLDRSDARNEFRVALRAALDVATPGFLLQESARKRDFGGQSGQEERER